VEVIWPLLHLCAIPQRQQPRCLVALDLQLQDAGVMGTFVVLRSGWQRLRAGLCWCC
jgi:hypothetical protein